MLVRLVAVLVINRIYSVHCSSSCKELLGLEGCSVLPSDDECGKLQPAPRVVGGHDANLGQFPSAALLFKSPAKILRDYPEKLLSGSGRVYHGSRLLQKFSKYPFCGGSMISSRYVLSAAHCCDDGPNRLYVGLVTDSSLLVKVSVRLGEHDLDSEVDCEAGKCAPPPQDVAVQTYVVHENFDPKMLHHDICLIRLNQSIIYNDFVNPVCLPTTEELRNKNYSGTYLDVAGWGVSKFRWWQGVLARRLRTTSLQVVSEDECVERLGSRVRETPRVCAGGGGEGAGDSCSGDSGGPLVAQERGRHYLQGLVSFGDVRCSGDLPSVHVHVPSYIRWIVNNIQLLEKNNN